MLSGLIVLVLALAAALRIYDLSGKDVWVDEGNGILMAQSGYQGLLEHLKLDSSPPLYYLLLGGWMRLFGDSEAAVRSLSVIAGVLTVGAVLAIGWRLFSAETGLLAALLAAVAPTHVFYSQQARMYSLLALLGLLSSYYLWRAIEDRRARFYVAYVLSTLGALYTHNFALHLLPAQTVVILLSGALRRARWRWAASGAAIAIGYLPWVPIFLTQLANRSQYAWFVTLVHHQGCSHIPLSTLRSFSPGDPHPFYMLAQQQRTFWTPVVLFGLTAAVGLARMWKRTPRGWKVNGRVLWLACATVLPLASAALTSVISTPNWVPGRVDQLVFPSFVLLVALGLTGLRSPRAAPALVFLRYTLVLVFCIYSGVGLARLYGNQAANSERALAQTIASHARPGDAVLFTGLTRAPVQYYLERLAAPVKLFSCPREMALHMGNQDQAGWAAQPKRLDEESQAVVADIAAACGSDARIFAVIALNEPNQRLAAYLSKRYAEQLKDAGGFRLAGSDTKVCLWVHQPG
jgi:mannosyltransferase